MTGEDNIYEREGENAEEGDKIGGREGGLERIKVGQHKEQEQ